MKKIVTIGGKEYSMKSSAWTQFKYKNDTGRKLLQDIQSITKLADIKEAEVLGDRDLITNGIHNDRRGRSKPSRKLREVSKRRRRNL